jgi:hypothetical protein
MYSTADTDNGKVEKIYRMLKRKTSVETLSMERNGLLVVW